MTGRLPLGALASLVALVTPSSLAEAHLLTIAAAASKARSEARIIAAASARGGTVPRVSVRSCRRVSHHVVDCRVRYRLVEGDQQEAVCRQTIRVRFYSAGSGRLVVSFPAAPACVVG